MHHKTHNGGGGYRTRTSPPLGVPSLPGLLPKDEILNSIPGGGVSMEVHEPDQPLDPICTPPCAI